jgi:RNA polymerase sigma factor (sigma-70 family)
LENSFASESTLMTRLQQGDETAYRSICTAYQDRIYTAILCIVQSVSDAEDLTQEVFVDAFLNIGSFNQKSQFSTWLYRIAINKALNHRRFWKAKKRLNTFLSIFNLTDEAEVPDFVHPAHILENKERSEKIYEAIDKLPANQRTAFVLRQQEDLSYAEIAQIMQTTIPSVESLLFRAKQNLQQFLKGKI